MAAYFSCAADTRALSSSLPLAASASESPVISHATLAKSSCFLFPVNNCELTLSLDAKSLRRLSLGHTTDMISVTMQAA